MENNELWLMIKDKDNKRIKNHIKFDIQEYVKQQANGIYDYIHYAISVIDDKNLNILKKRIDYNLTGLEEIEKERINDEQIIKNILYDLECSLTEVIEWVNGTLDWPGVDLYRLKTVIDGILLTKNKVNKFNHIRFRTYQQELLLNNDIINIINKFNNKINWQINDIKNGILYKTGLCHIIWRLLIL